jgi:hypothetical protein
MGGYRGDIKMSAYIVSDETIAGMLQATRYVQYRDIRIYWEDSSYRINEHNIMHVGQKLVNENYRSVNYRYGESSKPHAFIRPHIEPLTPVEIIKLCHCYRYQSCETEDWENTEAFAIYDALREAAIAALPGYEEAPWGL